jgi:hypothetical protein
MRKSEQYRTEWPQISFKRKGVKLEGTKNGSDREIPMNKTCLTAFERCTNDAPTMDAYFNQNLARISMTRGHGLIAVSKMQESATLRGIAYGTHSSAGWSWQELI